LLPFLRSPLRSSVRTRLLLGVFLVLAPISFAFGAWSIDNQRDVLLKTLDRHSRSLATATAIASVEPLLAEDFPVLTTCVNQLTAEKDSLVFASIEDKAGRVVAHAGTKTPDPETTNIYSAPIQFEGDELGRVVLGLSKAFAITALADSKRMKTIEMVFLCLALGLGLSWLLFRLIGRPLRILDEDARRLASTDLSHPIQLAGDDEFGRLAQALEKMRVGLRTSYEEISSQNEHLRELDRLKSEFLATMSHEIRTPMNGVIGFGRELLDTKLEPEQREMMCTVVGSAEELLLLLNDILDFSRLEASKLRLESVPTDLARLIEDVAKLIEPAAKRKDLTVKVKVDSKLPAAVLSDRHRIRQVLCNIMTNAVKFTKQGEVTLDARAVGDPDGPCRVRFSISDTGIGIPSDKMDQLFEPFRQIDGSHARKFGGSGLGLSICHRLVILMGGNIDVKSDPGEGSVFSFELCLPATEDKPKRATWEIEGPATVTPASQSTAGEIPDPPSSISPQSAQTTVTKASKISGMRVLLAEDNPTNQKLLRHVLAKLGTKVTVADTGVECLDAYFGDPGSWDLILMDCQMPEMDGFQATAAIRERETGTQRHTPIIAVTANAMVGDRERCLASGMDDYLTKPLLAEELRAVLDRWASPDPGSGPD
jgi:signal transduction histidine kinase/ActR/RegA family two-component response regulator